VGRAGLGGKEREEVEKMKGVVDFSGLNHD